MLSKPLVKYVLTAALRDRLILTFALMIAAAAGIAIFLGSSAITERGSFSVVFGAGGLRFLGILGIVLFCSFYMRRSFETKEVEFLLSRPVSRLTFLLSHAAAFMVLAVLAAVLVTAAVFFLGNPDTSGLLSWGISICIENMIMSVAALFFSAVLSSAAGSALASLGFYILARLIGTLIGIASVAPDNVVFAFLNKVMDMISVVIPRLDMMGQTSWLVYGVEGSGSIAFLGRASAYAHTLIEMLGINGFIFVQGCIFVALLLAATAFDFMRREF
jgi:ABC-type transport system involved in multi-copper enzyme maturation permease subunit